MTEEHATVRDWTDIIRRVRFGATVTVPGNTRGIRGATLRAVALMMATYADSDGSRVFPGTARLAVACEIDYRTAKRCLAALRHFGLITGIRAARRRQLADEYRLTIPADLLDRLDVLTPAAMDVEVERLRASNRRTGGRPTGPEGDPVRDTHAPVQPVDNSNGRVPDAPVQRELAGIGTGAGSTASESCTGAGSTVVRVRVCPPTHHYLDTTTTHHPERELSSNAAGPHARDAEEPDSDVVGEEPEPGPLRLVAGNPDAVADGLPRGLWPAPVTAEAVPATGHGFCVPCYATGQTTLAADPIAGSACAYHLRSA